MNLIFKIVEYLKESDQIVVKFCRQNAPKPIDEYSSVAINCSHLETSDYYEFVSSIMRIGMQIIIQQEEDETPLPENIPTEQIEVVDIETQLNRIICLNSDDLNSNIHKMNEIKI